MPYVRKPITFKTYPLSPTPTMDISKIHEVLERVEDDCKETIEIATRLKKGVLFHSVSDEEKIRMCDKIVEIMNR